jgi:hypothetical protein
MRNALKILVLGLVLLLATSICALAQRPRKIETTTSTTTTTSAPARTVATTPAPQSVRAKYEGGVFGYNKKIEGTLNFDDAANRLVFRDKTQKEILSIPYSAVAGAYADTKSRRPAAATAVSSVPLLYTLPAAFIRKKVRYLTVQFNDPDTKASGVTSFRMENKEILNSVLNTLAAKSNLTQRGDAFVRRPPSSTTNTPNQPTSPG